jgi:alpha-tubulin suppressor-like RCC1 family protein
LISGGTVQCWGEGLHGILGNGATSSSSVPVSVSNINSATLIEGGGYHNCALLSGGKIQCWGYGNSGQIGHGIFQNTNSEPAYVVGFGN